MLGKSEEEIKSASLSTKMTIITVFFTIIALFIHCTCYDKKVKRKKLRLNDFKNRRDQMYMDFSSEQSSSKEY